MSIRTIIEVNHDHLHKLKDDPEWARQLYNCLCTHGWKGDYPVFPAPGGVRVLDQRHHSETLKLTIE